MLILDASTLILIARIELLDIFLAGISMSAAVPKEVEKECCGAKKTLDALRIQKALDESRIEVFAVKSKRLVTKLQCDFGLGQDEAEAIALAVEEKAQLVGVDDKNGMNACKLLGVPFTTAAGILLRSRQKGLISKDDALAKLVLLAKYGRYKNFIVEDVRARLESPK
jgi:predicted nucleic acid-binding protein